MRMGGRGARSRAGRRSRKSRVRFSSPRRLPVALVTTIRVVVAARTPSGTRSLRARAPRAACRPSSTGGASVAAPSKRRRRAPKRRCRRITGCIVWPSLGKTAAIRTRRTRTRRQTSFRRCPPTRPRRRGRPPGRPGTRSPPSEAPALRNRQMQTSLHGRRSVTWSRRGGGHPTCERRSPRRR